MRALFRLATLITPAMTLLIAGHSSGQAKKKLDEDCTCPVYQQFEVQPQQYCCYYALICPGKKPTPYYAACGKPAGNCDTCENCDDVPGIRKKGAGGVHDDIKKKGLKEKLKKDFELRKNPKETVNVFDTKFARIQTPPGYTPKTVLVKLFLVHTSKVGQRPLMFGHGVEVDSADGKPIEISYYPMLTKFNDKVCEVDLGGIVYVVMLATEVKLVKMP